MRTIGKQQRRLPLVAIGIGLLTLACSTPGPSPINYGQDNCEYCNMTIVDQQFGAELVTNKGKTYKFDSNECLAAFVARETVPKDQIHSLWTTDFNVASEFINAREAWYVHTEQMRSPMGLGLFAFSTSGAAADLAAQSDGRAMNWDGVVSLVEEEWLTRK